MGLDRVAARCNVIDVLDHVLDKGIVVDAWLRVAIGGIDLITVEARMLVASLQTYVSYADAVATLPVAVSTPPRVAPVYDSRSIHERLRRIRRELAAPQVTNEYEHRRAEDRILDDLWDSRGRTLVAH